MRKLLISTRVLMVCMVFTVQSLFAHIPPTSCLTDHPIPFSTNSTHITIWNGQDYQPIFIKGMNLGVSLPGKHPGELEVSRAQYGRWMQMIKDAGYNTIRLYTLHYPDFYEVLDSFNLANKHNPLLFFQGVWLEEEYEGYDHDLYFLSGPFKQEIEENVNAVHGNASISHRYGKAWGEYRVDVSAYNMGYIIGREVHPQEVMHTNEIHAGNHFYVGDHFAIQQVSPTEAWVVSKLDHLVQFEWTRYKTQRPVSFSSWPTLDPLSHPLEWNRWEDTVSINLAPLELRNAPAGYFASYHAYPYYPDYISDDPNYQGYADEYGPNSYLGYLTALKNHYQGIPLIIGEFGVPSSWGIAHYSSSGMHHGGFDEYKQGVYNLRLLRTIYDAGIAGGFQFAWIDEWFKRTWITDHLDSDGDRRVLWHNVTAAEQNFGIIGFQRPYQPLYWEQFCESCPISRLEAMADFDYFHMYVYLGEQFVHPDEMWIALDTYDASLGERVLLNGETVSNRAEFLLHITNYSAILYVTEAYDLYGLFHQISDENQQYRSIVSDGAPWKVVRWKNNNPHEHVQYIGSLKVNYGFLPESSMDGVTIYPDLVHVRIPWSLIHFTDPSQFTVFHDDRSTEGFETTTSDGIHATIFYHGDVIVPENRFVWESWNHALEAQEYVKKSYWVMKDGLHDYNTRAIARCDSFWVDTSFPFFEVNAVEGLLSNDYDLDGNMMLTLLLDRPLLGFVDVSTDGSFRYVPQASFSGFDQFTYVVFDGYSLSVPARVFLYGDPLNTTITEHVPSREPSIEVYPNPARDFLTVKSAQEIDHLALFDMQGRMILEATVQSRELELAVSKIPRGVYLLKTLSGGQYQVTKVQIWH